MAGSRLNGVLDGRRQRWALMLLPVCILLVTAAFTPLDARNEGSAPQDYFHQAGRLLAGLLPFRDFHLEYPPLSLIPMLIPRLWPGVDLDGYLGLLVVENALLGGAIAASLALAARRLWPSESPVALLAAYGLLLVALAPYGAWRFELFAALLATLGLLAAVRDRPSLAGALLALGALVKIYPAVLLPVLALRLIVSRDLAGAARMAVSFVLVSVIVVGPFLLLAGGEALSYVSYQDERGLQIESTPAGLVLLADLITGSGARVLWDFKAWEVSTPLNGALLTIQTPAMVGLMLAVLGAALWQFRDDQRLFGRVHPESLAAYLVAAVLVVIVANKVLSPQYLLWLLPFGAFLPVRQVLLLLVASLLTLLIYPVNYEALLEFRPEMVLLLNSRNLLLWLLLGWLLLPTLRTAVSDRAGSLRNQPSAHA